MLCTGGQTVITHIGHWETFRPCGHLIFLISLDFLPLMMFSMQSRNRPEKPHWLSLSQIRLSDQLYKGSYIFVPFQFQAISRVIPKTGDVTLSTSADPFFPEFPCRSRNFSRATLIPWIKHASLQSLTPFHAKSLLVRQEYRNQWTVPFSWDFG